MQSLQNVQFVFLFVDDDATDDLQDNPFAPKVSADDESLYIDDPKRALNGFFEREGILVGFFHYLLWLWPKHNVERTDSHPSAKISNVGFEHCIDPIRNRPSRVLYLKQSDWIKSKIMGPN